MVSQNNDGNYYEIAVDTAKEGAEVWSLNDWFKARVGDEGTPLVMRFYTQGQLNSFDGHQKPIIQGNVGAYSLDENKQIVMAADAKVVSWTGDPSDMLPGGRVLYHFPQQMFPTEGAFYGFVGYVDESNGRRLTGVNVWFRVLGGVAQMGKAANFYISELDAAIHNANEQIRRQGVSYQEAYNKLQNDFKLITQKALSDLHDDYYHKVTDVSNALDTSLAAFNKLTASVGMIQGQIDARNIVSQQDFDKQAQALKKSITDTLSKVKFNAQGFASADQIKSTYPNGAEGIFIAVDTGHQWYWVDNAWVDAGPFQAEKNFEVEDGRIWGDGTVSPKIGDAIRGQILKEKTERIQNQEQEKTERIQSDEQLQGQINLYSTALEAKEVRLRDKRNKLLWDGNNYVTGNVYLPRTDKTGLADGLPVDSSVVGYTFLGHLEEYGLPILKLESPDLLTLTKSDGKLEGVKFTYSTGSTSHAGEKVTSLVGEFSSVKVQGASSAVFPKKNYTLKFDSDVCLKGDWGYHDKYVIKADWVDFSHMRNEFGAWLWGQIRKTRLNNDNNLVDNDGNFLVRTSATPLGGETRPQFAMGMNLGAIDSYPVLVIVNGIYHGLYSMTVPKDDWMANMGYGAKEAIVSAGTFTDATSFKAKASTDSDGNLTGNDFEVEYVTDEDNQAWISSSLNAAIDEAMSASDLSDITLIDKESLIDYVCLSMLTANVDGISKNYLLDTFDGKTWFFAAYDMDLTFGNEWNSLSSSTSYATDYFKTRNKLFELVLSSDDYTSRIAELKSSIISKSNLVSASTLFADRVQSSCFAYEALRWPTRKNTRVNTAYQITNWLENRIDNI